VSSLQLTEHPDRVRSFGGDNSQAEIYSVPGLFFVQASTYVDTVV